MGLFDLQDMPVLVTGGYGHLGTSLCLGLAEQGASVYVLGRSEERFHVAFADHIHTINFIPCDVADTDSVGQAFATVQARTGSIGTLVNNAAATDGRDPLNLSDEQFARTMDTVAASVYRCIREVVPFFRQASTGNIINIASMYGVVSPDFALYNDSPNFLNPPHYGAAKAAVIQMTKYFAWYLGPEGIRVNAVAPGAFPSPKVQADEGFVSRLAERTALKRIGRPEDLVGAVTFLASEASSYITGQTLVVDGGWTVA